MTPAQLGAAAAGMRRAFDQTFAAPEPPPAGESDDFLAVRVGGRPFAVPVLDLARVESRRKVVALPGSHPWLLGLASTQGHVVPVFSLELVLGLPATPVAKPWLVVCGRDEPFGLAFEALEGYTRVPRAAVLGAAEPDAPRAVHAAGGLRPVVSLSAVAAAVRSVVSGRKPSGGS
ncbi:chemotaxis protein CheW [bacterium]|nr:chemotaxis protein CheW [bacterium]